MKILHPIRMAFVFFALTSVIFAANAYSADNLWLDDIHQAIKIAQEEEKDLLLLYTGSDWCPPCKKLEAEVFSQDAFVNEAGSQFIFVMFDFPKKSELPDKTAQQNHQWATKFGIEGYPTVVLMDRQQRPFGITGYREGGVENYLAILSELKQKRIRRDEAFAKAEALEGAERATALDAGLSQLDPAIAELYYDDMIQEIVQIDNEDELGLRTKWNAARDSETRKVIMTDIVMISRLE
ncbi:MAG: thioredoxin family protein, partial [Planctomycetota bacterium]